MLLHQFRDDSPFPAVAAAAAAAKSLQSCPTLCGPIDSSPPGSPIPGILQARTLEWVAISFYNAGKRKVKVKLLSLVRLLATPWTAAHQAPPSMGFSRQEYWSGVPLPSPFQSLPFPKEFVEGENVADVIVRYKPTENVGGDADTEQEITLSVGTDSYHEMPTDTDAFVASVVEFALILRSSEYKADADLNALVTRLSDLDLSGDEFKAEFRELVISYREKVENNIINAPK